MKNMQIKNVILWQKNGIVRNLEFVENCVNVLTGDSGKGKSSIIHIIDYCLLASDAKGISKANIDSKVLWYGLRLSLDGDLVTIGRPSQESGVVDKAYYSDAGEIPSIPILNIRIDNLKKALNVAFGIDSEMKIPYGGNFVRAGTKVSFRNFLGFCYQDQNTIVSPEYLFIRPNDGRFQESIQRTFRLALGIETTKNALIRSKLADLEQKRSTLGRRIDAYEKKRLLFNDEIESLGREAFQAGVILESPESAEDALQVLKDAVSDEVEMPLGTNEIEGLEREIFLVKRKIKKYQDFLQFKARQRDLLKEAGDALKPLDAIYENSNLVFDSRYVGELLGYLQGELSEIRSAIEKRNLPPFFGEIEGLLSDTKRQLSVLEHRLRSLKDAHTLRSEPRLYHRFLGKLEAKLELFSTELPPAKDTDDELLQSQIDELKSALEDDESVVEVVKRQLDDAINDVLSRLRLKGYDDYKAFFNEPKRLVNLYSESGRVERMADIGSASNYLYLHIAFFLSIHRIARARRVPWMPSFLIFDQPSTPYFSTSGEPTDDIRSLDAVLAELNKYVKEMDDFGGSQVILLEHIEAEHWERLGLSRFRLVDRELRDDYGLILER
jgi:hypothetical protein